jgi:aminocarboxymuconate-semialdehyde decarboxylase
VPSLDGPPPSERLGQVYLDTAGYHPAALTAAIAAVGTQRIVVGTDYPPAGPSPAAALAVLAELDLEPAARQAILGGTARGLLDGARIH